LALCLGIAGASCGKRVPEPPDVRPGTPHVTWILMYGDRDNADREFACQSGPPAECVIPASRPNAQVFSDVHLYYHGAGGETRYTGTVNVGYFQGFGGSHQVPTAITVKKNESITNQSVMGIVTAAPGAYTVTASATATIAESGATYPIRETIRATVR
jgi:hypothetical protein